MVRARVFPTLSGSKVPSLNTNTNVDDCLELMRKLVEYRQQKALHRQLMKAADCSMLGIDAIVMLYHCAKVRVGDGPWAYAIQPRKRKSLASSGAAASITRGSARKIVSKI